MKPAVSKIIWITGASSGLGLGLARVLAAQGHRIIATARNRERLEALAEQSDNITLLPCDLTDPEAVRALPARLRKLSTTLDQVILNAGSCEYLEFPQPDWSIVRRLMQLNYFAAVDCIDAALPLLRRAAQPHLVAIASQATAAPFPRAGAYGASKAALQYFCASLRIDLAAENIDLTVVNPGFIDTPLTRKNDFPMPFLMSVETAATRIVERLEHRPAQFDFPRRLNWLLRLSQLMPGLWRKWLAPEAKLIETHSNQGSR